MKELKTWKEVIQAILDGEKLEYYRESSNVWIELQDLPNISINKLNSRHFNNYRIKPKTILIGDVEVTEPVRDASELEKGGKYFVSSMGSGDFYCLYYWNGDDFDLRLLKRGMIHKTKENAIAHAKALIKISGGSYE